MRPTSSPLSRRQILKLFSASVATGALSACSIRSDRTTASGAVASGGAAPVGGQTPGSLADPPRLLPGAVANRVLVLVELGGGNDGLSTVVPYGEGFLRDVRPDLMVDDELLLPIDDRIGFAPEFERLHRRGLTIVEGVGAPDHTLSHFEMERRWQRADVGGEGIHRFGYLGRLADAVDQGGVATGVSVAGTTPWMYSGFASTLSLPDPNSLWMLRDTDWDLQLAYLDAFDGFSGDAAIVASYSALRDLANEVEDVEDEPLSVEEVILDDMSQYGGQLARQLRTAADLISAQVGIRVIHARLDGFDTHDDHQWAHPGLLTQLDAAIDGFLRLMESRGHGEEVLVATVSEFGRRVQQNGGGLDHGAASTMLIAGPVPDRILGEPSPISGRDALDGDGNLVMTTGFDAYLGSLAQEWLGVEAASILPDEPDLLGIV
ncbi:MAG: DUF1501 domain-containing protein [Acidimicrobiales bacterium]